MQVNTLENAIGMFVDIFNDVNDITDPAERKRELGKRADRWLQERYKAIEGGPVKYVEENGRCQ